MKVIVLQPFSFHGRDLQVDESIDLANAYELEALRARKLVMIPGIDDVGEEKPAAKSEKRASPRVTGNPLPVTGDQ